VLVKYNTYRPKQMCWKSPIAWHGVNFLILFEFMICPADERSRGGPLDRVHMRNSRCDTHRKRSKSTAMCGVGRRHREVGADRAGAEVVSPRVRSDRRRRQVAPRRGLRNAKATLNKPFLDLFSERRIRVPLQR
jgi:hypothetical protein